MKTLRSLLLFTLGGILLLTGCASPSAPINATTDAQTTEMPQTIASPETTVAPETTAASATTAEPETTAAPETVAPFSPPEEIKILSVGNSFSNNAMEYFYQIARNAGVKKVTIGVLYYGGCSLQQHISFGLRNEPVYDYRKNTSGKWEVKNNSTLEYGLLDEDWDYVSIQEAGGIIGISHNFAFLSPLLKYVRERVGDTKLIWHVTWADAQYCEHSTFANYGNDQLQMYHTIVESVQKDVFTKENNFAVCVSNATSIQNARTSFLGDTLNREDGYHLKEGVARYIAALTYYVAITGDSVDRLTYNPAPDLITDAMMAVAHESVKNAIAYPFAITPSELTTVELAEAAAK